MTAVSASSILDTGTKPAFRRKPSAYSLSTRFLEHPRLIRQTLFFLELMDFRRIWLKGTREEVAIPHPLALRYKQSA
jgi:hypothetical protein